jgi:hypothetical protein
MTGTETCATTRLTDDERAQLREVRTVLCAYEELQQHLQAREVPGAGYRAEDGDLVAEIDGVLFADVHGGELAHDLWVFRRRLGMSREEMVGQILEQEGDDPEARRWARELVELDERLEKAS